MPPKRKGGKKKPRSKASKRLGSPSADNAPMRLRAGITGGFKASYHTGPSGQEDAETCTMVYETTSAFTSTAGAASYVQVVGNAIYHPYVGNTDSVAGYSRMYTQYEYSMVLSASVDVRLWGGVSGQDEPFRICIVPCTSAQYSVYSGFTNIAALAGVPHCKQGIFSPGGVLPRISAKGTTATMIIGDSRETGIEEIINDGSYKAASGARPNTLWYFLIGYQNFAGTTTTNQQAQVKITYRVKWSRPVATTQQALTKTTWWGNELVSEDWLAEQAKARLDRKCVAAPGTGLGLLGSETKTEFKTPGAVDKPAFVKAATKSTQSTGESTASAGAAGSAKMSPEEAFEEWTDVESEFAAFKAFCSARRKELRKQAHGLEYHEQKSETAASRKQHDPG